MSHLKRLPRGAKWMLILFVKIPMLLVQLALAKTGMTFLMPRAAALGDGEADGAHLYLVGIWSVPGQGFRKVVLKGWNACQSTTILNHGTHFWGPSSPRDYFFSILTPPRAIACRLLNLWAFISLVEEDQRHHESVLTSSLGLSQTVCPETCYPER